MPVGCHEVIGLGDVKCFDLTEIFQDRLKKLRMAIGASCEDKSFAELRSHGLQPVFCATLSNDAEDARLSPTQ